MEREIGCNSTTGRREQAMKNSNVPCPFPLREIQRRRHEHRHHQFSPFSKRFGKVVGPFCMVLILYCAKCEE